MNPERHSSTEKLSSSFMEVFLRDYKFHLIFLSLTTLMFLSYWPLVDTGLLSDDWSLASTVAASKPWVSLTGNWFGGVGSYYRPIPRLALYYQGQVFGNDAIGHHIISLLLHASIGAFLYLTLIPFARISALIAGTLFLFHPGVIETVGWISSQTDLFFLFFFSASLFCAIQVRGITGLISAGILSALACLSKETAIFLGPAYLALGGLLWYFVPQFSPEQAKKLRKYILLTVLIQSAIWIIYIIMRLVLLTSFLPDFGATDTSIRQMSVNAVLLFDNLLNPVLPHWFSNRTNHDQKNYLMFIPLLIVPFLFVWSLAKKHYMFCASTLLFGITMGTFIKSFESGLHLTGSERYLYFCLYPFCAMVGVLAQQLFGEEKSKQRHTIFVVFGLVFLMRMTFQSYDGITEFVVACEIRVELEQNLDDAHKNHDKIMIAIEHMPDHYGGAYVLRHGFKEIFYSRYDYIPIYFDLTGSKAVSSYPANIPVYRLNYAGLHNSPILKKDEALTKVVNRNRNLPSAVPVSVDFRQRADLVTTLYRSDDLELVKIDPENGLVLKVVGNDPNIGLPYPPNVVPASFKTCTIEMTLVLQEEHTFAENDYCELVFLPATGSSEPSSIRLPFESKQGFKKYTFELNKSMDWQQIDGIKWIRFDPSNEYRGFLIIRSINFE